MLVSISTDGEREGTNYHSFPLILPPTEYSLSCTPVRTKSPKMLSGITLMDMIRTKMKNWIGHITRGNSLQREVMEGRMEGEERKKKTYTEAHGLDDGGRIRETQRKGTTMGGVESMDIRTGQRAEILKKTLYSILQQPNSNLYNSQTLTAELSSKCYRNTVVAANSIEANGGVRTARGIATTFINICFNNRTPLISLKLINVS